MIIGELKNRIDGLWEIFWTGGLTNPLDVIEQMTYLMFIHDLDDADNLRAKEASMLGLPYNSMFSGDVQVNGRTVDGQQLKWSVFHDFPADLFRQIFSGRLSRPGGVCSQVSPEIRTAPGTCTLLSPE